MNLLPLYPHAPRAAIERVDPRDRDPECHRCSLNPAPDSGETRQVKTVCMAADGEPGGVYVVGKGPVKDEDQAGRPHVGDAGRQVRSLVRRYWNGPVAYDNAVRCRLGVDLTHDDISACRGYLASTLAEVKPKRVLALGSEAIYSVLGREAPTMSVRRGYGWIFNNNQPVPVFMLFHPAVALRNRFLFQQFEKDIAWALQAEVPVPPLWGGTARVVTTEEDAYDAADALRAAEWIAFDVETAGRMFDPGFTLLSVACAGKGSDSAWVWGREALANPDIVDPLRRLMKDPNVKKGGQNVKYDQISIRLALGVPVKGIIYDTLIWRRLLDPEALGRLEILSELVGMGGHKDEAHEAMHEVERALRRKDSAPDLLAKLPPAIETQIRLGGQSVKSYAYALLPHDVLYRYNARDAVSTAQVASLLEEQIKEDAGIHRVWNEIALPAVRAIEHVERWGIAVNRMAIVGFQSHLDVRLGAIRSRFDKAVSPEFNPSSSRQVGELLFKRLRLPPVRQTDSGQASTDRETLERLKGKHPIIDDLLNWRRYSKLKGTYADGLLEHVRADDRVHPSFHLDGARSGRLSCSDPNLQNIPRAKDSAEGKMSRDCFIAPAGRVLLEADYSQIELRVAAMLSGDPLMIDIFKRGEDYHLRTAQMVAKQAWGILPEQVEDKHRTAAKIINFRTLYGGQDESNAQEIGCTVEQAARIREAIFGKFTQLDSWIKGQLEFARRFGFSRTWWNGQPARRRQMFAVAEQDMQKRSRAEHGTWNTPIQGSASDFCLASVGAIVKWIFDEVFPAKLVLTVHDSIILEVDEDCLHDAARGVYGIMTGWPTSHGVKMDVDMKWGTSWGALQKYEDPSKSEKKKG